MSGSGLGGKCAWWAIALSLAVARVAMITQTSHLHPDEFFQAGEVVAGEILGLQTDTPWEAASGTPYRSYAVPLLLVGSPLRMLRYLEIVSPFTVLAAPRLVMVALSGILDICLWRMCSVLNVPFARRWLVLASSSAMLVYQVRTFSNAVEAVLVALGWLIVLSSRPYPIFLGVLLAVGVFSRITFPVFVFPLWALAWTRRRPAQSQLAWCMWAAAGIVPVCFIFVAVDSRHSADWHLAPFNNLWYNMQPANLALHGVHRRWTHVWVNGMVMFGMLWLHFLVYCLNLATGMRADFLFLTDDILAFQNATKCYLRSYCAVGTAVTSVHRSLFCWAIISSLIFPLFALSLVDHQEPRFLLPMLVPLVALFGHKINFPLWLLMNASAVWFFGFVHQSGLTAAVTFLHPHLQPMWTHDFRYQIHVVHAFGYRLPQHLLAFVASPSRPHLAVHNVGSLDEAALWAFVRALTRRATVARDDALWGDYGRAPCLALAPPVVLVLVLVPSLSAASLDFSAHGFSNAGPLPGLHWSSESPDLEGLSLPYYVATYLQRQCFQMYRRVVHTVFSAPTPRLSGSSDTHGFGGHGLKLHVYFRFVDSLVYEPHRGREPNGSTAGAGPSICIVPLLSLEASVAGRVAPS